jgi:hypothetical protein
MSTHKRSRFLSLNQISELVWDSEGYEAGALSDCSSEDKGGFEDKPSLSHWQPDWPSSRGQALNSSFSSNASDEEEIFQSGPDQQVQTLSTLQWTRPCGPHWSVVHTFRGGLRGQKGNKCHIEMMAPVNLVFSCCILWKLSYCWWWGLTDTTTATLTDLMTDLRPSQTWQRPKCLGFFQ